jgi:hypothetical protein
MEGGITNNYTEGAGIAESAMTMTPSVTPPTAPCPYRGLIPYGEEDAQFFFGRESWCQIIINNLNASPLTLLYGPSGVAKSSVLLAGVVTKLKQQAKETMVQRDVPATLVIVCRNWRDDPLATLRTRIQSSYEQQTGLSLDWPSLDGADLRSLLKACGDALARVEPDGSVTAAKLLLILDQFEEYFLYHPYEAGVGTFADEFPRAVNDLQLPLHVLISLREDSLAKLDHFKVQIPKLFANRLRIDHLDRDGAIDAILKPIQEFNRQQPDGSRKASVEPRLVQNVLEQIKVGQIHAGEEKVADQPDDQVSGDTDKLLVETPFLQLVMTRLWEEECQQGWPPLLRQETMARLGGAAAIVRDHLERLMRDLPEPAKKAAAVIFDKLVTSGLTKIAYPVFELTDPSKVDRPEDLVDRDDLNNLLTHLSGGNQRILRRIAPDPEQLHGEDRYEIFHDVLAKPVLEWRRKYRQAIALENEKERHAAELDQERQRREQELEAERRRRQRLWRWMIGLGILGGILIALSSILFAINQKLTNRSRELAVIEAKQQFKAKQMDEIDALVQALEAAHELLRDQAVVAPGSAKDIGANLRFILDNIQERQKVQLLSADTFNSNSIKMARILRDTPAESQSSRHQVVVLMRNGEIILKDEQGRSKQISAGLALSNPQASPSMTRNEGMAEAIAPSDSGQRIAALFYQDDAEPAGIQDSAHGRVKVNAIATGGANTLQRHQKRIRATTAPLGHEPGWPNPRDSLPGWHPAHPPCAHPSRVRASQTFGIQTAWH